MLSDPKAQHKLLINANLIRTDQKSNIKGGKNYFTRNKSIKGKFWVVCYVESTIGFWTR